MSVLVWHALDGVLGDPVTALLGASDVGVDVDAGAKVVGAKVVGAKVLVCARSRVRFRQAH